MNPEDDKIKEEIEALLKELEKEQKGKKFKALLHDNLGIHIMLTWFIHLLVSMTIIGLSDVLSSHLVETNILSLVIYITIVTLFEVMVRGFNQLVFKKKLYFMAHSIPLTVMGLFMWITSAYIVPKFSFISFWTMIMFIFLYVLFKSIIIYEVIKRRFKKTIGGV